MNAKRTYLVQLGVLALLLVGLLAGTYGANSLLASHADTLTALKAKSQALSQEQLSLANAQKEVKKYASLNSVAEAIVPQDKDQAEAVREVVNLAASNNVQLASVTFPESTLGNSGATPTATSTPSTASSAAAAAAASSNVNSPANKTSQLTPVPGIPGVYDLQITVAGDPNNPVKYTDFINFLSQLEHNRRTAEISAISLQPASTDPNSLTFNLTLNEYIKP